MLHPEDVAGRRLLTLKAEHIPAEVLTMIRTLKPSAEKRYDMACTSLSAPNRRGPRVAPLVAALLCLEGMRLALQQIPSVLPVKDLPVTRLVEAMSKTSNEGALCLLAGWECITHTTERMAEGTLPATHPAMAYRSNDGYLTGRVTALQATLRQARHAGVSIASLEAEAGSIEAGQTGLTGGDL